jgi:uncharacterized protein (DUF697 family)
MTEEAMEKIAKMQAEIDKLRAELANMKSPETEQVPVDDTEVIPAESLAVIHKMDEATSDADLKVETLCRWAAARAGVIVVAPLLGTVALMANEVYLVSRIARVYDVKLSERAVIAFIGALSGRMAGNILATLIPIGAIQVPIAIGITYSLGKVTQRWLKDGMPTDMGPYIAMMSDVKDKAKDQIDKLRDNPLQNVPLGDETIDFVKKWGGVVKEVFQDVKEKGQQVVYNVRHHDDIVEEVAREKAAEEAVATEPVAPEAKAETVAAEAETASSADPTDEQVKAAVEEAKAAMEEQK